MSEEKQSKSELTKKFIIEKTAALFNKKGFSATSISDITEITNLSKGSIYGNFENKDEIGLAAFDFNLKSLYNPVFSIVLQKSNAIEKLLQYPKYFKEKYKEIFKQGGCVIMNTAAEADDTHPALRALVNKAIKSWEKSLIQILDEGKKNEEINSTIDSKKYAAIFLSLFEGGVLLSKTTADKTYLFAALDQMEQLILKDLKTKKQ